MNTRQLFLLSTAAGLIPIALSYGLLPQKSLAYLFQISVTNTNETHIFRAVMGLYIALLSFWIIGALRIQLRQAALLSLVVFMLGLAIGRVISLLVDGLPNWLLVVYMVVEFISAFIGLMLLKKPD
jgi:hypothetical protein